MALGLEQLLDENLSREAPEPEPRPTDLSRLSREQISALAEAISGTGRAGSPRAYTSSRRQLERWRKGGIKPTLASRERLHQGSRLNSGRLRAMRARGADMRLFLTWGSPASVKRRRRGEWLPPHEWIHIGVTVMRRVIGEWGTGELAEAADLLLVEFLQIYAVPNPIDFMDSGEVTQLRLEPSR